MKSVFRRPDLRSQRPKSIFHHQEKNEPLARSSPSSKNLSSILALSLTTIVLPLGSGQQASPTNPLIPVNSVGGVYFSESLLVPYLLVLFL
ncbi:hypothetical protein AVEN_267421-1 [Araneus ventricosus]|uniref:Uncharacterized protein n=1 Tax=Araneus ventricosus TaxID=182803 RepID=A0A4Y2UBW9_ARAVE|nr:hypothetical protein AVEN_267421-1 [Araneus ventricosus]